MERIVVGMSGGVDSSIALVLLKKQGYEPVGVSLKLETWKDKCNNLKENVCCTEESFDIARKICKKLNVPYYVYDVRKEFKKKVMDYFLSDLKKNKTPNPCVICNRSLKFRKLFDFAKKKGIKYVATGHYAKIKFNKKTKKYELLKAKDKTKDQTYGLSFLPQTWLKDIKFPLGDYTKKRVFDIAKKEGFEFFLKRKQSQDLCFISKNSIPKYIEKKIGVKKGKIVDTKGNVLGEHKGVHFYTIGQRRRLGLEGYFVKEFDTKKNLVIVTRNVKEITKKEVILKPYNFISREKINKKIKVVAKVGYGQELTKAVVYPPVKGKLRIIFNRSKQYVREGQFCVFYQGNRCLGAGIIN